MLMAQDLEQDQFLDQFESDFNAVKSDGLGRIRTRAWDGLKKQGLPTKKREDYRYLPLRKMYGGEYRATDRREVSQEQIAEAVYPECKESVLVLVNGRFAPELSNFSAYNSQLTVSSLDDAIRPYSAFLNNKWAKAIKEEVDPFVQLNAALNMDGVLLYVPPRKNLEVPLQILHVVCTDDGAYLMPQIHLLVGAEGSLNVACNTLVLGGKKVFFNSLLDVHLEDASQVKVSSDQLGLPDEMWHFSALRANLKRDSRLVTTSINLGTVTQREDYAVRLLDENAEASLNGLWMSGENRQCHTHVLIDHQAPNCRSSQLFKGALSGSSRSSFEGKILVRQKAQKTDAYQLNNNLLLSDNAHADSKPNLEIFADDVKASHGSTVGQLDQEQLLYLRTRGCSERTAKRLLISGYMAEIIEQVFVPSQKSHVEQGIEHAVETVAE